MYIIYIDTNTGDPLTQIYDAYNVECTHNLNAYDVGSFELKGTHEKVTLANMQVYNRIRIARIADGEESQYFVGLISWVEADLDSVKVFVKGEEWVLEKKYIDTTTNYNDSVVDIVDDMLTDINARYDTGITLDCDEATVVTLNVTRGASMLSALQELAKLGYEFRIIDRVLTVAVTIGEDKSTPPPDPTAENTGYYEFDGVDDHVVSDVTHSANLVASSKILFGAYFRLRGDGIDSAGSQPIIDLPYVRLYVRKNTNEVHLRWDNAWAKIALHTLGAWDRDWHFVSGVVYNNGSLWVWSIWIDWVWIQTITNASWPSTKYNDYIMLAKHNLTSTYGYVDVKGLRVFTFTDTTFDGNDAVRLAQWLDPVYTTWLVEYINWQCNEWAGTTADDSSGNGRTGTLTNGVVHGEDIDAPFVILVYSDHPWYVALEWDSNEQGLRNIKSARVVLDGDQLTNAVFGKTVGFSTDAGSITQYGRVERFVTGDGSEATLIADTLEKNKELLKQIELDPSVQDFFFANIGDIVAVNIVWLNELVEFQGTARIMQKSIDTRGMVKVIVSKNSVKTPSFFERIREYDKRISKLEQ